MAYLILPQPLAKARRTEEEIQQLLEDRCISRAVRAPKTTFLLPSQVNSRLRNAVNGLELVPGHRHLSS